MTAAYSEIDLGGEYVLSTPARPIHVPITLPGDVHAALLVAGEIPDPYDGDNEKAVMWVHQVPWSMERRFNATPSDIDGHLTLTLDNVDCFATVFLNGEEVARTLNQFVRYDIDVTGRVHAGDNSLRLEFAVTAEIARARAEAHPFPIPFTFNYQSNGLPGYHLNFVRKAACHAGWDWGICLMPIGVYGRMALRRSRLARQESVTVEQAHKADSVALSITTRVFAFTEGSIALSQEIDGQTITDTVVVRPGENSFVHSITIASPKLWWPSRRGAQPLYDLVTTLDGEVTTRGIGLRRLEWIVEKDEIDHSFKVRVNGHDITAMGANWIPADAIPSRIDPTAVRELLESARDANMNMIRLWGGGQYEPDWFYDLCDELGLMVWHDFMFSCMSYPSDRAFLAEVEIEITQQLRRLQHHAAIALWCGDNEVIGSIGWYSETRDNRERYVANYTRLNSLLQRLVEDEDPGRRFWPSSPSLGYLDFSDGWHTDTRGDVHFWQVWHEAAPFERAREVNPRFASEFGFQSFPSMPVIESFAGPGDRHPASPVMESHQRNPGGNARIVETMERYFRTPRDFDEMVFLSQVQQGLAIKTAIEYWRSTKPRCMGTLYWQLNDIYPVASWSSLNYGGSWKLLHHMARRFYLPVTVVAVPDGSKTLLKAINDTGGTVEIALDLFTVPIRGNRPPHRGASDWKVKVPPGAALTLLVLSEIKKDEFLFFAWKDAATGAPLGENDYFPLPYKAYELPDATVASHWDGDDDAPVLVLSTDSPALFVTASVGAPGHFSDNAFTLLPGREARLRFVPRPGTKVSREALASSLRLRHLRQTY
ncbi:MAG: glycoside hydrolase family 2 protein [Devosia sp.]